MYITVNNVRLYYEVTGIGAPLVFAMNHYAWNQAGAIALGLVLLVWLIDMLSAALRRTGQ